MDDAGMLVGVGVLVGVITCWGDWKGVGLASTEGEGVGCVLLWTGGSTRGSLSSGTPALLLLDDISLAWRGCR